MQSMDIAGNGTCGITKDTSGKYVQSAEVVYLLVQSLKASGTMCSSLKLFKIQTYNFF